MRYPMKQLGRARWSLVRWPDRSSRHRIRGQSLVEFALVLPIFILLMAGIADVGIGLFQYMNVINGARVGARFATLNATNPSAVQNAVQSSGNGSSATVTVSCWSVAGNGGTQVPTTAPGGTGWGIVHDDWDRCANSGRHHSRRGYFPVHVDLADPHPHPDRERRPVHEPHDLSSTIEMLVE